MEAKVLHAEKTVMLLRAQLREQTSRADRAETEAADIQRDNDGVDKGLTEEMRNEYEMAVKLTATETEAIKARQACSGLEAVLGATTAKLTDAQRATDAFSTHSEETEVQLQATRADNKWLADAMRQAQHDTEAARAATAETAASARQEIWGLELKIKDLGKDKDLAEWQAKRASTLFLFYSTSIKQQRGLFAQRKPATEAESRRG